MVEFGRIPPFPTVPKQPEKLLVHQVNRRSGTGTNQGGSPKKTPPKLGGALETEENGNGIWNTDFIWLVVGPPLWKIWKSVGMVSNPILVGKCQFDGNQTTNQLNIQTQPREDKNNTKAGYPQHCFELLRSLGFPQRHVENGGNGNGNGNSTRMRLNQPTKRNNNDWTSPTSSV